MKQGSNNERTADGDPSSWVPDWWHPELLQWDPGDIPDWSTTDIPDWSNDTPDWSAHPRKMRPDTVDGTSPGMMPTGHKVWQSMGAFSHKIGQSRPAHGR